MSDVNFVVPPHISWLYEKQERVYNAETQVHKLKAIFIFIGKNDKDYISSVKKISDLKDSKFKGRVGLRKAPFFMLFTQRTPRSGIHDAPIIYDNHFIDKWTGGLANIKDLNSRILIYPIMKNKYTPNPSFHVMLDRWINAQLKEYFDDNRYGEPRNI